VVTRGRTTPVVPFAIMIMALGRRLALKGFPQDQSINAALVRHGLLAPTNKLCYSWISR